MKKPFFCIAFLLLFINSLYAGENDSEIEIEYNEIEEEDKDDPGFLGVNRLLKNPAVVSGLNVGAANINRSIDSLMEGLFYSLMDHEFPFEYTDASTFKTKIKRDLHSTSDGSYVVVDRFSLGPEFGSQLTSVKGMPISIGADSKINILNIFLRNDAMRIAENEQAPLWRFALNNWFGALPLLSNILPPSFNPNEMYDPLGYIQTPFVFPFSASDLGKMPIGSIRSYSINSSIGLPVDFVGDFIEGISQDILGKQEFTKQLPYTIFKTGEHRINVLRRSSHTVWVGSSDSHRIGHGINATTGKTFFLLSKLVPFWTGMPVPIFPVDVEANQSKVVQYDRLFEFDLRSRTGINSYNKAVHGRFPKLNKEKSIPTKGQIFHFTRTKKAIERGTGNTRNLFIHRSSRNSLLSKAEVKTVDPEGEFYILEADLRMEDEFWDVLVGAENVNFSHRTEIKVIRAPKGATDSEGEEQRYLFDPTEDEPISLHTSMNITDRFLQTREFRKGMELLRFFTALPMKEIKDPPIKAEDLLSHRRKRYSLADPMRDINNINVTPTYLGRINAQASIVFSHSDLLTIAKSSDNKIWRAFAQAFGVNPEAWGNEDARDIFSENLALISSFALYPFRFLNIRFPVVDAYRETADRISAIRDLNRAETPVQVLDVYNDILNTDYPAQLTRAFLNLVDRDSIPRMVSFSTKAKYKGYDTPDMKKVKNDFQELNQKIYKSNAEFPPKQRYRITNDKLSAFNPKELKERRSRPKISKLILSTKKPIDDSRGEVFIKFKLGEASHFSKIKAYLRIEQGGKVNVGRFLLGEKIIDVEKESPNQSSDSENREEYYSFYLSGPYAPFDNFMFNRSMDSGGSFVMTISISESGHIWSKKREIKFRYEDGKIIRN